MKASIVLKDGRVIAAVNVIDTAGIVRELDEFMFVSVGSVVVNSMEVIAIEFIGE
jgi:hypothetical protein